MKVKVYTQSGEAKGTVELPDAVFGLKWNADLVHQVVTSQAANRRPTIAHTKSRGEVRGGGRKPWVQKGTGRARHGSIRSPIWIGGGVTHGPRAERSYKKKINKKMARKALFTALSAKARDKEIVVLDGVKFDAPKTKYAAALFAALQKQKELGRIMRGNGVLVSLSGKDDASRRALRNLPYVGIDEARNLNAWEVMQYKYLLLPKKALEMLGSNGNKRHRT
ncbi:MAG: 50S ribosomal protein L4 [Candidatus Sungbacteria bacterium RIFCSPHIGHO2_02_FULL_47_11]|uniref:Large ribosomal subunit protein uL4 n=1 Tax=Candidatus Sungbacteria bacterium RIFCSPHIGHO2_02_FULL_47_11 TaxID=1802270 RepID=A0A1G2KLB6_9BACT|nr:MAG: 50S ribosomal protein L4 [Candidatus Sungbacteria bacterium RIFCSPHIGHO2_02_FULL_47_11]